MPGGDGTGPMGLGPMTGRAAGYCAGYPAPGFMNPIPGRWAGYPAPAYGYGAAPAYGYGVAPGYGYGYGMAPGYFRPRPMWGRGRGLGWGRGRGRGFGRGWRAAAAPYAYGWR